MAAFVLLGGIIIGGVLLYRTTPAESNPETTQHTNASLKRTKTPVAPPQGYVDPLTNAPHLTRNKHNTGPQDHPTKKFFYDRFNATHSKLN
jgi:hypothetical protein